MPALFIAATNLLFPALARRFTAKALAVGALVLYVVAGIAPGAFDNIGVILALRALVGVSVGVIMPLSTGLLAYYFGREEQDRLMGYSSAMNQMGGVVATLIAGFLAGLSWRAAFLVYLMGLVCVVLCALFLPNDVIGRAKDAKAGKASLGESLKRYGVLVAAMFMLMFAFFVYPSCFALETAKEGMLPSWSVTPIMAGLDLVAFFGGLAFARIRGALGRNARFFASALFVCGYALLAFVGGWTGALLGSALIGFANGAGVPYLMSTGSRAAGKDAAMTVMPLLSMALYLSQFLTPAILSAAEGIAGSAAVSVPYVTAMCAGVLLALISAFIRED